MAWFTEGWSFRGLVAVLLLLGLYWVGLRNPSANINGAALQKKSEITKPAPTVPAPGPQSKAMKAAGLHFAQYNTNR